MAADIFDAAAKHRAALAAGDRAAAGRILEAYGAAWQAIDTELRGLLRQIERAQAEGLMPALAGVRSPGGPALPQPPGTFSADWVRRAGRLDKLKRQAERRLLEFAEQAELIIVDAQREAIRSARAHAAEATEAALARSAPGIDIGNFDAIPEGPLDQLVGHLADGSPLRDLLDELGPDGSARLERGLLEGLARGQHPSVIARNVREALGGNAARALTIARTETLRAYREATRQRFEASSDVVAGWTWHAALDGRTCGACWAMHGTEHPVTDTLDGHPNCRCRMLPVTKTWEELGAPGVDETRVELEAGADAFARLPPSTQRMILGKAKHDAYLDGELELGDLVGRPANDRWGTMRRERSLREIRLERLNGADTSAYRLGRGIPDEARRGPGPVPGSREPGKRRRSRAEVAAEHGMTPEQLRAARADLDATRARVRAEARLVQDDALGFFERNGATKLRRPPPRELAGGEWDWYFDGLDEDERKRLRRRWFGESTEMGPDEFADALGLGGSGTDIGRAMEEWLEQTRRYDAASSLARGKVPSPRAYGPRFDPDDLLSDARAEGLRASKLFDPDFDTATRHLAEANEELAERHAARALSRSKLGPEPYDLTYDEWLAEVEELAPTVERAGAKAAEDEWGPALTADEERAVARMEELWPSDLDDGILSPEQVHERITELARISGRLDPIEEAAKAEARAAAAAQAAAEAEAAEAAAARAAAGLTRDQYEALFPRRGDWTDAKAAEVAAELKTTEEGRIVLDTLRKFQGSANTTKTFRSKFDSWLRGEAVDATTRARAEAFYRALANIDHSRVPSSLWRGMRLKGSPEAVLERYGVGETFDLRLSSFSSDRKSATAFTGKRGTDKETRVLLEVVGNKKALPVQNVATGKHRTLYYEKEWLSDGTFEVIGARRGADSNGPFVALKIRQKSYIRPR